MDDDKLKRQMEFIVEQQAQFAATIGQLEDGLVRQGENIERLTGVVERVVDTVARMAQATLERFEAVDRRGDETDRKIAALVDAQLRMEEESRKTEEAIRNLAATVERHIVEGHNGRAGAES